MNIVNKLSWHPITPMAVTIWLLFNAYNRGGFSPMSIAGIIITVPWLFYSFRNISTGGAWLRNLYNPETTKSYAEILVRISLRSAISRIGYKKPKQYMAKIVDSSSSGKAIVEPNWKTNPVELEILADRFRVYQYTWDICKSPSLVRDVYSLSDAIDLLMEKRIGEYVAIRVGSSPDIKPLLKNKDFEAYGKTVKELTDKFNAISNDRLNKQKNSYFFKLFDTYFKRRFQGA